MRQSISNRRGLTLALATVMLALVLAALACTPTTSGGGDGAATSAPVSTKDGSGSGGTDEATDEATEDGGEATPTEEASSGGGGIDADNVEDLVDLQTVTVASGPVPAVAISGADHTVATFSADRTVRLWDGDTGKKLRELPKHADLGFGLAFSKDGKLLASGAGFQVTFWDPETGKRLKSVTPNGFVYRLAFSPDAKTLLVAGDGRSKLDLIDVDGARVTDTVASPLGLRLFSGAYSSDGKLLAAADLSGNLTVFEADSKSQIGTGSAKGAAWDVEFSPDSKYVTTCNSADPGGMTTWDTSNFAEYSNLTLPEVHNGGCSDGVYSTNGEVYFSGGADGVVNAWEVSSGKLLFSKSFSSFVWSVAISGDGEILAVGLDDGTLHIMGFK